MKRLSGILSAVLCMAMVLMLFTVTAFAATEVEVNGTDKTLADAIDEATEATVIKLTASITESVTIPTGKEITIDLNGNTLTNAANSDTISNHGTLTVKDSVGSGKLVNVSSGKGALVNYYGAVATLSSGTYTASGWYTIKNMGTMTIESGTKFIGYSGASLIANGWYGDNTIDRNTTYGEGEVLLTINGGDFNGGLNTVKNDDYGVLEINDGIFYDTGSAAIFNAYKAKINNGQFTAANGHVVVNSCVNGYAGAIGELELAGGTFISGNSGNDMLFGYYTGTNKACTIKVTGGDYTGKVAGYTYVTPVISRGSFSEKVNSKYIAEGKASIGIISPAGAKYYIGSGEEVAQTVAEKAAAGDRIEIYQGTVNLNDVGSEIQISNVGGTVTVDGKEIAKGDDITYHENITEYSAKDATCTEDGNIAYWYCSDCQRYFNEENNEISYEDTIIPHDGHSVEKVEKSDPTADKDGNVEYWHCTKCGRYFSDKELTKEIQLKDTVIKATGKPATGDSNKFMVWIAVLAAAAVGIAVTVVFAVKKSYKAKHSQ